MVNQKSIKALIQARFHKGHWIRPLYESYCSSNITEAIENIFFGHSKFRLPKDVFGKDLKRYKHVVLLLVDGFGWNLFEKTLKNIPFLTQALHSGVVSQLTSQFPSTTAAQITSFHAGLPVGQTGVYEWFYYEKKVDAIIAPLLFSFAGDKERNTLQATGVDPKKIFPQKTFFARLKKQGIDCHTFIPKEFLPSPYLDITARGSSIFPYQTLSEGFIELARVIRGSQKKSYSFFYFDKIDKLSHTHGPFSDYTQAELESFFMILQKNLFEKIRSRKKDTLLLITADHGHRAIHPKKIFYLNEKIPSLEKKMKKSRSGEILVPGGSCRNMFLYIQDQYIDEVYTMLRGKLKNKAEIYKREDLLRQGFFGPRVNMNLFRERVGNIIILPDQHHSVWWNKDKRFTVRHVSYHSGLSLDEMMIPFISIGV